MNLAVEIQDLTIRYKGSKFNALNSASLKIPRGSFFGLLGPNGAGKTTFISFLCGQTDGKYVKAQILGEARSNIKKLKRLIGYAPQEIALYSMLSARENLNFFASILALPKQEVDRVLDWVGLSDRAEDLVSEFSGGMKRRLNLGIALLNKPELLILDEPTVGVDPQSRNFIFDRLLELRAMGLTLIYSTHYMEEVRRLCTDVGILQEGRFTASGDLQTVMGEKDLEQRFLELTYAGRNS